MSTTILDVEAENSVAHTIALSAVTFGTKCVPVGSKTRSGKVLTKQVKHFTVNDSVVIKLRDVKVRDDKKNLTDLHTCLTTDFKMLFMTFEEAMEFMCEFIEEHGGTLSSHCLVNDLGFLGRTQEHVLEHNPKAYRYVRSTIEADPKNGFTDRRWKHFNLVKRT